MDLRKTEIGEFRIILERWAVTRRSVFLSIPKIAGLIDDVDELYAQALRVDAANRADDALAQLSQELEAADKVHDDCIRCIDHTLSSGIIVARLKDAPARVTQCEELSSWLLPRGLSAIQDGYIQESGNVLAILASMDAARREALKAVRTPDGESLLEIVEQWGAAARKLGSLEERRSVLLANLKLNPVPSEWEVKLQCIDLIKDVLKLLSKVKGQDEAVIQLRDPVIDIMAAAEKRAARRQDNGAEPAGETTSAAPSEDATIGG